MNLLTWLSLLRVPILFWLIYGPGLIYLMWPKTPLSGSFADLGPVQFFFAAAALWCAAVALAATSNLVLLYGRQRIEPSDGARAGAQARPVLSSDWVILAALLPSSVTIGFLAWSAPQFDPLDRSLGVYALLALAALAVIFVLTVLLVWLALLFTTPYEDVAAPPEVILPLRWVPRAEKVYRAQRPARIFHAVSGRAGHRLAPWLGPGYLDPRHGGLLPGHNLALLLLLGHLALYAIGGISVAYSGSVYRDNATPVIGGFASALAFILLLLMLAVWLFGALAFFLDRWRIPVLAPFVVAALFFSLWGSQDHYFPVIVREQPVRRPAPTDVILSSKSGPRVLLVASAGGGIQAAAWTTAVMAGLQQRDPRFRDTVRLVSGVSGGSVGLFYSLRMYPPMEGSHITLDALSRLGGSSVLEGVAHALVYPWTDRGQALENGLGEVASNHVTLGRYAHLMFAAPGSLPGVILNATSVEEGSPVAFSTTTLFDNGTGLRDWLAADSNHGVDVRLPTAARLSATFPYVTPSARAWNGQPSFRHFGDGGYFDNYGLYSSMAWLEDALGSLPYEPKQSLQVLLLAIESFPEEIETPPVSHGHLWQLLAPVDLLYNARSYSQRHRDDLELELYRNRFVTTYGLEPGQFANVTLRYHPTPGCEAPPLSWHLSPHEKQCIAASWLAVQRDPQTGQPDPAVQKVLDFVAGR